MEGGRERERGREGGRGIGRRQRDNGDTSVTFKRKATFD